MTTITVTFDPPLPSDSPATFNSKAFDTLGDLNTWSGQANTVAGEVNTNAASAATSAGTASTHATTATTKASEANASAVAAASSASSASTSAGTATTQAGIATTKAEEAAASAVAAAAATSGKLDAANPSYTGTLTGGTGVVNLGSGQVYKAADGKVGFGTTSPSTIVDAVGTITSTASAPTGYNLVRDTAGVTTGRVQSRLRNTSGDYITGVEGSTAGATLIGSAAYSAFAGTFTSNPYYVVTNGVIRGTYDTAGNFGLGVPPSALWGAGASPYKVMQIGVSGAVYSRASNEVVGLSSGMYIDAVGEKYLLSGNYASNYTQAAGVHKWFTTNSTGTAGDPISFGDAKMTLGADARLRLVGASSDAWAGKSNDGLQLSGSDGGVSTLTTYLDGTSIRIGAGTTQKTGILITGQTSGDGSTIQFRTGGGEAARIDNNLNLLVGTTSTQGATYRLQVVNSTASQGDGIAVIGDGTNFAGLFLKVAANGYGGAFAAQWVGRNSTTSRSINAGGTINANGADYAEYEQNNGLTITKGSIVGFKADGTLTLTYSEAVRFAVKSTNPSYVGGDTWGSEDAVGKRPKQPTRKADITETTGEGEDAVTTVVEAGDTDEEWQAKQDAYTAELAEFEARLEAARQLVDRIAYSGKVPCNVTGATPGDYIVATAAADGSITGVSVTEPNFAQYRKAVGRVNRLLPDGRCEVAVIIH